MVNEGAKMKELSGEAKFNYVTRIGIEKRITEAFNAGDINLANEQLDIYPYGRRRNEISTEEVRDIGRHATESWNSDKNGI